MQTEKNALNWIAKLFKLRPIKRKQLCHKELFCLVKFIHA